MRLRYARHLTLSCVIATDRGSTASWPRSRCGHRRYPLLLWGGKPGPNSAAALLTAMTEVSLFLMWLSFSAP